MKPSPEPNLTQEEAIRYLAREAVTLSADTPRGLVLVTYEGYPLGSRALGQSNEQSLSAGMAYSPS